MRVLPLDNVFGEYLRLLPHVVTLTSGQTGSILAAWLTFAMVFYPDPNSSWAWKIPSLFQGLGPLLLLSAFWIPESPRWLIKNGRRDEAHRILAKYQYVHSAMAHV